MNDELKDRDRWNDPAANFLTVRCLSSLSCYLVTESDRPAEGQEEGEEERAQVPKVRRPRAAAEPVRDPPGLPLGRSRPRESPSHSAGELGADQGPVRAEQRVRGDVHAARERGQGARGRESRVVHVRDVAAWSVGSNTTLDGVRELCLWHFVSCTSAGRGHTRSSHESRRTPTSSSHLGSNACPSLAVTTDLEIKISCKPVYALSSNRSQHCPRPPAQSPFSSIHSSTLFHPSLPFPPVTFRTSPSSSSPKSRSNLVPPTC